MARDMVRAERQGIFKSQDPTGLGGKRGPKIKCNMSWARRCVPGSAESLAKLPPGCEQSRLYKSPGSRTWNARFRHPKLMEIGKRPTGSKTYMEGVTEHQAFQIVVTCLWRGTAQFAGYVIKVTCEGQSGWKKHRLTAQHARQVLCALSWRIRRHRARQKLLVRLRKTPPHWRSRIRQRLGLLLLRAVSLTSLARTSARHSLQRT